MPKPKRSAPEPTAVAVLDPRDYPYDLPRILHKPGETYVVRTIAECDAALADGWVIHPDWTVA